MSLEQAVKRLKASARSDQLEGMAKYGLGKENRLSVSMPNLSALAKEIGKDHDLALHLWQRSIYFEVADCDATVEKTASLGDEIAKPAADTPMGRFAVLKDPQGAVFQVISYSAG